jgi:hypothetical protein
VSALRRLRKLVLGETWALPLTLGAGLAAAGLIRVVAGPHGWWRSGGGFVLLAVALLALRVALPRRR